MRHDCCLSLSLPPVFLNTSLSLPYTHASSKEPFFVACKNNSKFPHNMLLSLSLSLSSFLEFMLFSLSLPFRRCFFFSPLRHCYSFAFNIYFLAFNLYEFVITYNLPVSVLSLSLSLLLARSSSSSSCLQQRAAAAKSLIAWEYIERTHEKKKSKERE
jgi:hypothetical protein